MTTLLPVQSTTARAKRDWTIVSLDSVTRIVMGQSPPSSTYHARPVGLPFLQGKAEFGPTSPRPSKWCDAPLKRAPAGSTLLSVRAPVGDANLADREYCIGRGLASIAAGEMLDAEYLYFFMLTRRDYLRALGTGSTFQSINGNVIRAMRIPLPPLDEQRRIARMLSSIQAAKGADEGYLATLNGVRRSTIEGVFADAGTALLRLGSVIERPQYGLTASASWGPGPRFLRITDISAAGVDWKSVPSCEPDPPEGDRYSLRDGDLLVARIGATTGKAWLVRDPPRAVFASYLIRIRTRDGTDPRFIAAFFESDLYRGQIDSAKGGRLKGGVNIENLTSLQLPSVATADQKALAGVLDSIKRMSDATRRRVETLELLFASALAQVFGAVV